MLLAIDIGNSNVTIGLVKAGSLVAVRRAMTPPRASADELELLLDGLLRLDDVSFADVSAIACASVVPSLTAGIEAIAARRERSLVVAEAGTVPIAIRVDRPSEVGADRLVNALAAAAAVRHAGRGRRLRHGDDVRLRGGRRCLRRRGDRARTRAGPRGARGEDREAAANRARGPRPRDRAGHGRGDAVRGRVRLPRAGERTARTDPARARREPRRGSWRESR